MTKAPATDGWDLDTRRPCPPDAGVRPGSECVPASQDRRRRLWRYVPSSGVSGDPRTGSSGPPDDTSPAVGAGESSGYAGYRPGDATRSGGRERYRRCRAGYTASSRPSDRRPRPLRSTRIRGAGATRRVLHGCRVSVNISANDRPQGSMAQPRPPTASKGRCPTPGTSPHHQPTPLCRAQGVRIARPARRRRLRRVPRRTTRRDCPVAISTQRGRSLRPWPSWWAS